MTSTPVPGPPDRLTHSRSWAGMDAPSLLLRSCCWCGSCLCHSQSACWTHAGSFHSPPFPWPDLSTGSKRGPRVKTQVCLQKRKRLCTNLKRLCLSVCLSLSLFLCQSVSLTLFLSLSVYLSVSLSLSLSFLCLSLCLSLYLSLSHARARTRARAHTHTHTHCGISPIRLSGTKELMLKGPEQQELCV